jgi:hypothetical protein
MQDLISFVQANAQRKREDLAGEVLALLLCEDAGQKLIRTLLKSSRLTDEPIEVVTRKAEAGCIPDIHLRQNDRAVALLELKFDAALTAHQLSGRYFEVADELIFIVPEERVACIRQELLTLAQSHALDVRSWADILGRLETTAASGDSSDASLVRAAIPHLKEFCRVVEEERYRPFTSEELGVPSEDSSARHLVWLTQQLLTAAKNSQIIGEVVKPRAGYDTFFFYGQNVHIRGYRAWVGYWPRAWSRFPQQGPLWVQFYDSGASELVKLGGIRFLQTVVFPIFTPELRISGSQEDEVASVSKALELLSERIPQMAL